MFDIGFMEILLISIVALLVLGPDKLPQAVRTSALWIGRARRSFNKVKSEIEQQLNTDEIRRQLHNESILKDLEEARKKATDLAKDTSDSLSALGDEVNSSIGGVTGKGNKKPSEEVASIGTTDTDSGEDADNTIEDTSDGQPPEKDKNEPVTDFYNNPESKVVTLKDGAFSAPEKPDTKESDTGKKDND